MAPHLNGPIAERAWRPARVRLLAISPDGAPADPAAIAKNQPGQMARAPHGLLAAMVGGHAFVVVIAEPAASEARRRVGADALGVHSPDGKSAFVFHGTPPLGAREGARLVDRVVLPAPPPWLARWLDDGEMTADEPAREPVPKAMLEPAPSCATCAFYDGPTSECREAPPTLVIGSAGVAPGWLLTKPGDVRAAFTPRTAPQGACHGCRWFAAIDGTDGRRGICRGSPPIPPLDNSGRLVGRAGHWPTIPATAWCRAHERAVGKEMGRAA